MIQTLAAILVFCGCLMVAGAIKGEPLPARAAEPRPVAAATTQAPEPVGMFAEEVAELPESEPVSMAIPDIGVKDAVIDPVGLNADQTIEVPPLTKPDLVGWYKHRPTPGEAGGAVLVGHVDAYGKPAVFSKVRDLKPGAEITVGRQDGTTARFVVDALEQVDKDAFPTDKVYGKTDAAELRLITCGGAFDQATGHYEDNIIVYAHLVS
ncbi:class F sortase [Nonomuraea sp. NPDC050663]|uniref:class F sortase n=1 Tax=Nonomuraea sp. NPDC050663 TaxID=3364370 RepID=UPI0037B59D5A